MWIGEALAMHLLNAEGVWNHPAFFDYADRWMTEDDTQAIVAIKAQSGFDYSQDWERQGCKASFPSTRSLTTCGRLTDSFL